MFCEELLLVVDQATCEEQTTMPQMLHVAATCNTDNFDCGMFFVCHKIDFVTRVVLFLRKNIPIYINKK